mgnify:CR=1 FL=1
MMIHEGMYKKSSFIYQNMVCSPRLICLFSDNAELPPQVRATVTYHQGWCSGRY